MAGTIGSAKVKTILQRFNLSEKEKAMVVEIIKYHGEAHSILDLKKDEISEEYEKFELSHKDILIELILLVMADVSGSQLKDNNPDDFG